MCEKLFSRDCDLWEENKRFGWILFGSQEGHAVQFNSSLTSLIAYCVHPSVTYMLIALTVHLWNKQMILNLTLILWWYVNFILSVLFISTDKVHRKMTTSYIIAVWNKMRIAWQMYMNENWLWFRDFDKHFTLHLDLDPECSYYFIKLCWFENPRHGNFINTHNIEIRLL